MHNNEIQKLIKWLGRAIDDDHDAESIMEIIHRATAPGRKNTGLWLCHYCGRACADPSIVGNTPVMTGIMLTSADKRQCSVLCDDCHGAGLRILKTAAEMTRNLKEVADYDGIGGLCLDALPPNDRLLASIILRGS